MIDRLGEINRVLIATRTIAGAGPHDSVPLESVLRVCAEAVQGGLLPDHEKSVAYACAIGFLAADGVQVHLTDDGLEFLSLNPDSYYELTQEQSQVLARNHYLGGAFQGECREIMKRFSWSAERERFVWSEIDDAAIEAEPWVIDHLCQLQVLARTPEGLLTPDASVAAVASFVEEPKGLTEQELQRILREKIEVGDLGERLVVQYEKARLAGIGQLVAAHCVRRISKVRVNAGYDVESFDTLANGGVFDRFIEVKSARSKTVHFFWTDNEMNVAKKLGEKYWIYFQGAIDAAAETSKVKPLLFQNPLQSVLQHAELVATPQGYLVRGKLSGESV